MAWRLARMDVGWCRGGGGGREGSGRGYRREEVSARVTAGSRGHWVTESGL